MAMELKGKIVQILPLQTGQGKKGQWKKQEFIVETQSQYPKKVCLSIWGEKIDQFRVTEGEIVNASVELESREYNSRWYTEARVWKLEKSGGSGSAPMPTSDDFDVSSTGATDDLPF